MGGRRHLPLRPPRHARPSTRSTRRRRRSAGRCMSVTCSRTRTPMSSRASSACAGKAVFYPMGWDDNGLPTERRVQNYYGVRCDPSLPYDPAFVPPANAGKQPVSISRPNFVELCETADRRGREGLRGTVASPRPVGGLVDDLRHHRPRRAQRVSQRRSCVCSKRRTAYQVEAPTLWDVDFRTAVAQAELEDREMPGAYHRIRFARRGRRRARRDRHDAPGTDSRLRGARRASRRRALPAALRPRRDDAALRRAGARARRIRSPTPRRAPASR